MSGDTSNSLVNLGELSKPADTLIRKVSNAVGGLFAPHQIKRLAKAEARAALIKTQSEIDVTELHKRAVRRWIDEEAQRQNNMEDITTKALPRLSESANADSVENDWVVNFFDKSRIVSDQQMQDMWSRILAGEANAPGTYSRRTVNFLSDLDKVNAELFARLCGFVWASGALMPLVFDVDAGVYNEHGINFGTLSHLDSIGLVTFNNLTGFRHRGVPKTFLVHYFDRPLLLEMPADGDNDLDIGHVVLTRIGNELAPICGSQPVDGFWEYVNDRWKKYLQKSETR